MTQLLVLEPEVEAVVLQASRELEEVLVKVQAGCLLLLGPVGRVDPGAGCLLLDQTPGTRPSCTTRSCILCGGVGFRSQY